MKLAPDLVRRVGTATLLIPGHQYTAGDHAGGPGKAEPFPHAAHGVQGMRLSFKLPW